jgi:LacI family transcriptional regulator
VQRNYRHIGLMIESLNGYGSKILTGISRYARQRSNWRVAYFDREQKELADLVEHWQGDGIICSAVDARFATAASRREIPVINVTGRFVDPAMVNVTSDDRLVGAMAAKFLLERGFKSFAYLRRKENLPFSTERGNGFLDTLAAAGFKAECISIGNGGDEEVTQWLSTLRRPLAVLGATDRLASMVIEACWHLGLKVPEEVSVLGIGNHDQLCELCSPTLSSVDVDMERRGYEAAEWLDRILDGEAKPTEPWLIPPAYVADRRSTDTFAFEDADVVAALRFIHDHATESIKVGNVVKATGLSRRSLEGRFNKLIGRTIHDEIWKAHFDLAMRLLSSSDLSLQTVAERSGFRTASALVNLFRLRFGMTPKEYRVANRLMSTAAASDADR